MSNCNTTKTCEDASLIISQLVYRLTHSHCATDLQKEDPLASRTILYQMVALYDYDAQGPEDLEFSEGDTIDILGEGEAPRLREKLLIIVFVCNLT